jgi:hypothetical protein
MALQVVATNSVGTGTRVSLGTTDDLYVAAGVVIASTDGNYCIESTGTGQVVHVEGELATDSVYGAVSLGLSNTAADAETYLGANSIVRNVTGGGVLLFGGAHTIELHGKVFAALYGVQLGGGTGAESFITNDGLISADDTGVFVQTTDYTTIENAGKIEGDLAGIWVQDSSAGIRIDNSGTIKGEQGIVNVSTSAIIIENSGLIRLGAQLGNEADTYDGSLGRITGDILAGTGDDTVIGGASTERIIGQAGADRLTGGGGGDQFIYESAGDSTLAAAGRDLITDFSLSEGDFLDLSSVIVDELEFVGKKQFTESDQVRYVTKGGTTTVLVNLDTDNTAEMAIRLTGKIHLEVNDFAL